MVSGISLDVKDRLGFLAIETATAIADKECCSSDPRFGFIFQVISITDDFSYFLFLFFDIPGQQPV